MPLRKPVFTVSTLHQQLKDEILRRIRNKEWTPGAQLPSEVTLAEEFGVSVGTVRKVLTDLEYHRVVERKKGRGTFIRANEQESLSFRFYPMRNDSHRIPSARPAAISKRRATERERGRLQLAATDMVVYIRRVCVIDDTPAVLETITVPAAYVPGLESVEDCPTYMLLHYHDAYGVVIQSADEFVSAATADDETAISLDVPLGTPLLVPTGSRPMSPTGYSNGGCELARRLPAAIIRTSRKSSWPLFLAWI